MFQTEPFPGVPGPPVRPHRGVLPRRRFLMQSGDAEGWSGATPMLLFYKRNLDASCLLPPSWGQTGLDSKSCSLALLLGALPAGGGRQRDEYGRGGGPHPVGTLPAPPHRCPVMWLDMLDMTHFSLIWKEHKQTFLLGSAVLGAQALGCRV